jgi:hypothetical protein
LRIAAFETPGNAAISATWAPANSGEPRKTSRLRSANCPVSSPSRSSASRSRRRFKNSPDTSATVEARASRPAPDIAASQV